MKKKLFVPACIGIVGLVAVASSIAIAETSKQAGQGEIKLPPGWTEEDMKACTLAATPGELHKHLAKSVGVWHGKNTMWMAPDAEPMTSECTATITSIMDGRFTKCEWEGEMPGMGPYHGFGINGFDNVSQKFVSIWIDNHGTGILNGKGELSPDGKVTTYEFNFNCPITKKPAVLREVETITGPNTKTLEMFSTDPKTGKEYKMMSVELSRKSSNVQAGG
jgi:hypothetical protein